MTIPDIQTLVGLPEEEAQSARRQAINEQRLRWLAAALAACALMSALYLLFEALWLRLVAPMALLAVARWIFLSREHQWGISDLRLVTSLLLCWTLACFLLPEIPMGLVFVGFLGPISVTAFRIGLRIALPLTLLLGLVPLAAETYLSGESLPSNLRLGLQLILIAVVVVTTRGAMIQDTRNFRTDYRVQLSRSRERSRMRDELGTARQIQLSMLPQSDPKPRGLEISSLSLPAAEVGGDYYDFFELDDGRFAVTVVDVAGHGVGSGLVLSGLRSCLYLLHAESTTVELVIRKLDRMLRETTERRMFGTILYSIFDADRRSFAFCAAGHPPPLVYRASTGEVEIVECHAPPLGTRLSHSFEETRVDVAPGDVALLYTDGAPELLGPAGEPYGEERLISRLKRSAPDHTALEIREILMSDLWTFKGDAQQPDDVTFVVVRVPASEPV